MPIYPYRNLNFHVFYPTLHLQWQNTHFLVLHFLHLTFCLLLVNLDRQFGQISLSNLYKFIIQYPSLYMYKIDKHFL